MQNSGSVHDMSKVALSELAVNGGPKVRRKPWPGRSLLGQEEKAAVDALFDQAIATGQAFGYDGPVEKAYCEEFSQYMGGGFTDAVNSGSNALYVALRALDLPPYSEVIVSCITDAGGMMPIPLNNLIPVVADAAPGGYNIGPEQVEAMITPLTSAIVVAHIMGEPVDMDGIMAIARRYNLRVVEDCAQAHSAKLNGKPLGSFGDIGVFSTMFGKHHITGSQGGLVFTKDEDLYWRIRRASDRGKPHGCPAGSTNQIASLNCNLGDLGAAIGRVQLKKLPAIVAARRRLVAAISEGLREIPAINVPKLLPGAEASYWYFRLEVNTEAITCDKATFVKALQAEGILLTPSYAHFPHRMEWFRKQRVFGQSGLPWSSPEYKGNNYRDFPIPNAEAATAKQFNLHVYESWGEEEINDILAAFRKVASAYSR